MYDVSAIQTSLKDLVGFENPANPTYAVVSAANQTASSGRYFTDNSFVKIELLQSVQDYISADTDDFNDFLAKIKTQSARRVIDRVFNKPDFIDRQVLYKYANNKIETDDLPAGFVGYEIDVSNEKNYAFEITRDLLEFASNGTVTLLLYNTSQSTPIYSKEVTITSRYQEVVLNWTVTNSDHYKGQYFYGYLTNGMTIKPYRRNYENADIKSYIEGLCIRNIEAVYSPSTNELFDLEIIDGADESWGLNPDITVYDDYTDFINNNERIFSRSIQLQGQIICLEKYLANIRSSRNERFSDAMINKIVLELEGQDDIIKKQGLKSELSGEITRISKEVERLQKAFYSDDEITRVVRS